MKSFVLSKTIWVQIVAVLCMFIPAVKDWFAANPVQFVAALGAINILVRFVTSGKVTVFADSSSAGTSGSGGTSGWTFLVTCAATVGFVGALPSCATTVTETTMPDGTKITVTAKASDAVAIGAAVDLSRILLPIVIHPTK